MEFDKGKSRVLDRHMLNASLYSHANLLYLDTAIDPITHPAEA